MKEKVRFNNLKKDLYNILDVSTGFSFNCSSYNITNAQTNSTMTLPRWSIALGRGTHKEVIWDFPRDFMGYGGFLQNYPHDGCVDSINAIIKEYINTPVNEVINKDFGYVDRCIGLSTILISADKRINKNYMLSLLQTERFKNNLAARKIASTRILGN